MTKKSITSLLLSMILVLFVPLTVNAKNDVRSPQGDVVDAQYKSIISNNSTSKVRGVARGRVISSSELELADEGQGVIGVYASTLCHTAVKEIHMTIYLDVWDEAIQDWKMVDNYEYQWRATDNPDKDLTAVSVSFSLEGLPRGEMYSLRGVHIAKNFNNVVEVMTSETDGITLN